ncbi:hypothetical protein K488DRAFT_69604 [Vararia minispora EC-137]|uniref:Uncharacterized protein n=1 Tax=Vararia minispora EC-137 TaxID=1314806 RepID=A0ACB8QQQ6_9AGAM|nr:hypothetical protein K488DRAFT_69604 [Vararia minispora EC-137]
MLSSRFVWLAALVFAPAVLAVPTSNNVRQVVFPVTYQEWNNNGCTGSPSNSNRFVVSECADLTSPAQSIKLNPMPPPGTSRDNCTVQFWDAPGCNAAASTVVPLTGNQKSACIRPSFEGQFSLPPVAQSARDAQAEKILLRALGAIMGDGTS